MFDFFKKKTEQKQAAPQEESAQNPEYKAFAASFLPEELTVLAVTGANGFGGGKAQGDTLWTASIGLTAWMEEDTSDIHRGEFRLTTLCDEKLLEFLRQHAPRDFIIRCKVRVSEDGKRLLLLDLPEPGFDPELKAILEEQKKPVTFWEDGLGTFALNREVDWFETEVDWLGTPVTLCFGQDENRADCVMNAKSLLASAAEWDRRVREYAADELLDTANDWAQEEAEPITREGFLERMELESIEVREDGSFDFWFSDGELFYGHSIRVSGDLENGPSDADMEG